MTTVVLPEAIRSLPVLKISNKVIESLKTGNVLLKAEPGAGKSTGLPLALLLDEHMNGNILLLEPRRLAARAVAARLASHLDETVGQRIGLRMRGETQVSNKTRLTVVTEGVLTRLIQADPALEGVSLVIFDEFHERSVHADLGLALCIDIQQALNDRLRLLLMSATLDMQNVALQLGASAELSCPVKQHPVDVRYLGDDKASLLPRIASAVVLALEEHEGDVLVFLPGVFEITRVQKMLSAYTLKDNTVVLTLHSGVSRELQERATCKAVVGVRRVILATSLAETSITIDGVRVVIDSGLERRGRIDSSTGSSLLETVTASQASATQRAGRAGRTMSGICYRLWSEQGQTRRALFWQPEILRADLAPVIVELALWGVHNYKDMAWTTEPSEASVLRAQDLLTTLGLWESNRLSTSGKMAASLPVHPRLASMLLWAIENQCLELACQLAVVLEDQSRSDSNIDLDVIMQRELSKPLKRLTEQLLTRVQSSTHRAASGSAPRKSGTGKISIGVLLAQAYPDWIAKRRASIDGAYTLACGAGATIDRDDALAQQSWLVVGRLGGIGKQPRIFKAAALSIADLERDAPHLLTQFNHVAWDEKQLRVVAERRLMVGKVVVSGKALHSIDDNERVGALLDGIRSAGIVCLPWTDECRQWQARVTRMHDLSDHHWPEVDDESLMNELARWLSPYLQGLSTLASLQKLDLHQILRSLLDYQQQLQLEEWLPVRYRVPSGSNIRLSYVDPGNPWLQVRLQEMFGCAENPAVACGRLPLKVLLLSPAGRVVQVTEDLANFWTNSYPAVKKDMAGRYPKHNWPQDPLSAVASARVRPRKS